MKFLIFVVCGAVCMANVDALQCYTTDIKTLSSGKVETKISDCGSYMKDILNMQGKSISAIDSDDIAVQCFSVNARGSGQQHSIKGCTPKGGCALMKTLFKAALESSSDGRIDSIDCLECEGEWCNSGKNNKAVFGFLLVALFATFFY